MSNRESLSQWIAHADHVHEDGAAVLLYRDDAILAAARERLAQLPKKCEMCGGVGEDGFDRNASHTEDRYVGYPCLACHGKGVLYPPALVERIAAIIVRYYGEQPASKHARNLAVAALDALNDWKPE